MRLHLAIAVIFGVLLVMSNSDASPLDQFRWKNRVLVVVAPVGDASAKQQRQIYQSSAGGMSERQVVLTEARDDSDRSRQIRAQLASDGTRFRVFLIGKDGNTAISSETPLSADYLFKRIDAMPMRQNEIGRPR